MLIDNREPEEIRNLFPNAEVVTLEIGDIASDDMSTIIERKDINDLLSSIMDGRYKDQVRTLMELPSFIIIVGKKLSGYNATHGNVALKYKIVNGAISSLQAKYRIPTFHVDDNDAFVKKVNMLMDKRKNLDDLDVIVKRHHNDPQLNLFASISNIGATKAKVLKEAFNSMGDLCKATQEDIKELDGFGQKTANNIYNTLRNL